MANVVQNTENTFLLHPSGKWLSKLISEVWLLHLSPKKKTKKTFFPTPVYPARAINH